jgi:hypothetical protein
MANAGREASVAIAIAAGKLSKLRSSRLEPNHIRVGQFELASRITASDVMARAKIANALPGLLNTRIV